jgi:hypothetical protein
MCKEAYSYAVFFGWIGGKHATELLPKAGQFCSSIADTTVLS